MSTPLNFPSPEVEMTQTEYGIVLENAVKLPDTGGQTMLDKLEHWASVQPNEVFMAERKGDDWVYVHYADFFDRVKTLAAKLLNCRLGQNAPLMLLAPNSIDHAIVSFAAMYAAIPVSPISPAYALVAKTFDRLEQVVDILQPGAVFVNDANLFAPAIEDLQKHFDFPILCAAGSHSAAKNIDSLTASSDADLKKARASVTPQSIAKIMFTSGSTGVPKGVLNTHQMMHSNQVAVAEVWPFLTTKKPKLVDWLPWSHTFGGNVSVNCVLFHGGTFFIDDGKPAPALIKKSIENIKHGKPNIHLNVPAGLEALIPFLESDVQFCREFLGGLDVLFVAAAALPQKARDRIQAAADAAGVDVPKLLAGWGSTETAPFSTAVYFDTPRADNIGVPIPGTKIKLVEQQDKLELCVKGPNVTPGYWRNDSATRDAFDEQGYYRMGDAGKLIDESNPSLGVVFDGRISENFKLASGTWVNVGALRVALIDALRPYCLDAVITGHNEAEIGAMLVPNVEALTAEFALSDGQQNPKAIAKHQDVLAHIQEKLDSYNEKNSSNSKAVKRFRILPVMPRIELNEVTDKGYLNQRKLLQNWSQLVADMHAEDAKAVAT